VVLEPLVLDLLDRWDTDVVLPFLDSVIVFLIPFLELELLRVAILLS